MTYKEALDWCEQFTDNLVAYDGDTQRRTLGLQAMEVCKKAIMKQIPKKPIKKNPICYEKTKDGQESYAYEYFCPMCDTKVNKEPHHCPCGQALDWSDTDD